LDNCGKETQERVVIERIQGTEFEVTFLQEFQESETKPEGILDEKEK
jgi:hypothetical protein